jgi:hypothetical protein
MTTSPGIIPPRWTQATTRPPADPGCSDTAACTCHPSRTGQAAQPPRPAVDPAIPAPDRALLTAPGAPLVPASRSAPSRPPSRIWELVPGTVAGLAAATAAAGGGVLLFGAPAARQAAPLMATARHGALWLALLIAVLTIGRIILLLALCGMPDRETPAERAARQYHGRYLTPEDLDPPAAALLGRAQHATAAAASAQVTRDGPLDDPAHAQALAEHEWDIATALRDLTRLRRGHGQPPPTGAARRALRDAQAAVSARVQALEAYAAEVTAADDAWREYQAAAQPQLTEAHLDLLARTAAGQHATARIRALTQHATAARCALNELNGARP